MMTTKLLIIIMLLSLLVQTAATATPYTPQDDAQILEQLPVASLQSQTEVRRLQDALRQTPSDPVLAAELAWQYIALGRASADPRYYGYAQAALMPWWTLKDASSEVLLVRATIHQNRHEFAAALKDLQRLLAADPRNAQAWLTQAVVFSVTGEHQRALQSCMPLMKLAEGLLATTCISHALSLSGQAGRAAQLLSQILEKYPPAAGEEYRWALTVMAEIAVRLGQNETAERYFQQALQLQREDVYLLIAYADFLLDQQRYSEVIYLLEKNTRTDALLLRLALAERQLNLPELDNHKDDLLARARTAERRADSTHLGDRSRLYLQLLNQPSQALSMALSNWQLQREPRDARLVLEAALAAHNAPAAGEVIAWIRQTRLEDIRLTALIAQLEGKTS
jgi:tetratricopeptide (TPR) repeat protein